MRNKEGLVDDLITSIPGEWKFDEQVSQHFDTHVRKSVPIFTYSSSGNVAVVFFSSVRRELIAPRVDGIILFCGANILFLTTSDTQLYGIIFCWEREYNS